MRRQTANGWPRGHSGRRPGRVFYLKHGGAHRSLREEFYTRYRGDWRLRTVNRAMEDFQRHYCRYRPHGGRGRDMLTLMEYYRRFAEAA